MRGTITVRIDEDAKITVEVDGVIGKSCEQLTSELIKKLGMKDGVKKKAEYHKTPKMGQSQQA